MTLAVAMLLVLSATAFVAIAQQPTPPAAETTAPPAPAADAQAAPAPAAAPAAAAAPASTTGEPTREANAPRSGNAAGAECPRVWGIAPAAAPPGSRAHRASGPCRRRSGGAGPGSGARRGSRPRVEDRQGRYGVDAHLVAPRPHDDGAGARALLRRHGAAEERAGNADAQLHHPRPHLGAVGALGLQSRPPARH